MSFDSEIAAHDQFKDNVVIRINSQGYFAKHQPDSGLLIQDKYLIVKESGGLTLNPEVLDLLEATVSFPSNSFILIDLNNIVSDVMGSGNADYFIGETVEIWIGSVGVNMDFADYHKLPNSYITAVKFKDEEFTFQTQGLTSFFSRPCFNTQSPLNADTAFGAGTLVAQFDITDFPASGKLFIQNEYVNYSSKNNGTKTFTLTGATANSHNTGDVIYNVTTITNGNPIEILLKIIQSTGGGTWDTLAEGLAVPDSKIDIAAFTAIRDSTFSGELFTFNLYGIPDILKWMQDELLKVCSLRFINSANATLSITVLDSSVFGTSTRTIDDSQIEPTSVDWNVDETLLRNSVTVNYGYDAMTNKYARTLTQKNQASITAYGATPPYVVNSQGIPATAGGDAIATDRVTRWLARYSLATPTIAMNVFRKQFTVLLGERVKVKYDLPSLSGGRNFSRELELINKGYDSDSGLLSLIFGFTNYTNLRECFISPSDNLLGYDGGTMNPYVEIPNGRGQKYSVGWKMAVYDNTETVNTPLVSDTAWLGSVTPLRSLMQDSLTITSIVAGAAGAPDRLHFYGQSFEFYGSVLMIQFTDYDNATSDQHRYGFISNGVSNFADASAPYQITF